MSCKKCESIVELRDYFESNCVCNILIENGNCENCLYHGEYCKCDYVFETEEVKKNMTCPISFNIFQDPVIAVDGHTYERKYIEDWFKASMKSPMTGESLSSTFIIPNHTVRSIIKNCKKVYKNDEI